MITQTVPTFVIIGAGGISKSYAQAFVQGLPFQIVGVADIRLESAKDVAAMVGVPAYDNVDRMIEELKPMAAIVCTPPSTHPDVCIRLMEQGVNVLCEKPLAISTEEAVRMAETAERCHVVFSMGSKFRFVADVQKAREIIDSGILGDIILYENTFAGFCDMSKRWNSQPAISGGGVLIDNGTHSVDILRFLLGNITELQVVEGRRIQNLPVEDTALLFVRTEGGTMGNIDLSWSLNKVRADFISLYGSKGTLSVGWKESKYKLADQKEWTVFGSGYDKVAAFGNQIKNFGAAILGTEELIITPADAIASVRVIETAYAALQTEQWHQVAPAASFRRNVSMATT
ncbi:MAG TPA: Gfo/Idh/MocA family oxidoreductase [Planctomycetaceae bacterium]|nr:Gfo/Idh/MocA family oxidoreductase [Planctomycetaceae bacterium]